MNDVTEMVGELESHKEVELMLFERAGFNIVAAHDGDDFRVTKVRPEDKK